jgi:hypothetical protein
MRTIVELKPEHRSRLLAIAAKRGERGISGVLREAIELYLGEEAERGRRRRRALQLQGVLTPNEAADLRRRVAALRKWPNFAARRREIIGDRVLPGADLLIEERRKARY